MLLFEKFFGLIELEFGGIILGWIGIISCSLCIFVLTLFSILHAIDAQTTSYQIGIPLEIILIIYTILYTILFLNLWAAKCLLNGIKNRDHKQVYKYVIVDKIMMILSVLLIFESSETAVVIIFWIYLSICTYKLYKKLEKESNQGSVHNQMTTVQSYPIVQNGPQVEPGYAQVITYQQPQPYPQPQVYQQPQPYSQVPSYQLPQAYQQPPTYQEAKSAEANQ